MPFLSHASCGSGMPSAWQRRLAVTPGSRAWLSGCTLITGGTAAGHRGVGGEVRRHMSGLMQISDVLTAARSKGQYPQSTQTDITTIIYICIVGKYVSSGQAGEQCSERLQGHRVKTHRTMIIYIYLHCKSVWMRPTAEYVSRGQDGSNVARSCKVTGSKPAEL